jgi:hypothetical protein
MRDPVNLPVDGAAAQRFESKNKILGETTEVWFIGKGFLYEVTTYRDFGNDVVELLKNWQFL